MQSLKECYATVFRTLEEASIEGQLQDPDLAKRFGYPTILELSDEEKEEMAEFISELGQDFFGTMNEMGIIFASPLDRVVWRGLTTYMFNTTLSGALWERFVRSS